MGNFKEDIALVEAFVFDVDGVFTNGDIIPTADGDFLRAYNAKDGFGVTYAVRTGYKVGIITGGRGKVLEMRFKMLNVTRYHANIADKLPVLKGFMEEFGLRPEQVLFMGDDLPDLECMRYVGMPVCPADAVPEVQNAARYISQFNGGAGCVRDMIEQVLRARGHWNDPTRGVITVKST